MARIPDSRNFLFHLLRQLTKSSSRLASLLRATSSKKKRLPVLAWSLDTGLKHTPPAMKIWESEHTFEHPWETVVQAAMRKYPNPLNPAVVCSDVSSRTVRPDGTLVSGRLMATEWHIPSWVSSLIGLRNPSFGYEYSEVNPATRTMTLMSRNLNCTSFVSVDEKLVYREDPERPGHTHLAQSASVTVKGVPLIDYCENLMTQTIHTNASKGREGLEWVIGNVKRELTELEHLAASLKPSHSLPSPQP